MENLEREVRGKGTGAVEEGTLAAEVADLEVSMEG